MKKNSGFTLIELSIVLVIIGLIVGGVLVGQDLIKAAELRSVASEQQRFKTAVHTFKLKYNCLVGDCANATTFFATASNGNGDKRLGWTTDGYYAWQHLGLAGLIEGSYTGTATANEAVIGTNIPPSKMKGGGWGFIHWFSTSYSEMENKNFLMIGGEWPADRARKAIFTPREARSVDEKLDDGVADSGRVYGLVGMSNSVPCITGTYPNADYDLDDDEPACHMHFRLDY